MLCFFNTKCCWYRVLSHAFSSATPTHAPCHTFSLPHLLPQRKTLGASPATTTISNSTSTQRAATLPLLDPNSQCRTLNHKEATTVPHRKEDSMRSIPHPSSRYGVSEILKVVMGWMWLMIQSRCTMRLAHRLHNLSKRKTEGV